MQARVPRQVELLAVPDLDVLCREAGIVATVGGNDGVGVQALVQVAHDALRLHRPARPVGAFLQRPQPLGLPRLRLVEEAAVLARRQPLVEGPQAGGRITDDRAIHRVAQADAGGVDVDLDAAHLAGLRIVLDVREGRADDQQRVARREHLLRRPRAEISDATHDIAGDRPAARTCRAAPWRSALPAAPPCAATRHARRQHPGQQGWQPVRPLPSTPAARDDRVCRRNAGAPSRTREWCPPGCAVTACPRRGAVPECPRESPGGRRRGG